MILSLSHFRASPLLYFPAYALMPVLLSRHIFADKIYEEVLSHEQDQENKKDIEEQAYY